MTARMIWLKLALGLIFGLGLGWWLAPYFAGTKAIDPIWLTLGSFQLYWYGLLMAVAVLTGFLLVTKLSQRYARLDPDATFYILVATAFGGVLGARLLFVILSWPLYAQQWSEIWQIHHGGMSIHGAIIGGAISFYFATRHFKLTRLDAWRLMDLVTIALPLGQAIGRFGNFFNQEAFGGPTALPWKMFVAPAFRPTDFAQWSYFHPTFLYEAIGNVAIVAILWQCCIRRGAVPGTAVLWYLILYSSLRFIVEWWRVDSLTLGWLTLAQWGSLALIVLAVSILVYRRMTVSQHHGN